MQDSTHGPRTDPMSRTPRSMARVQRTSSVVKFTDDVDDPRRGEGGGELPSPNSSFGNFPLMGGDDEQSTGRMTRRKSLATMAFEQASQNRDYAKYVEDSMQGFSHDSEELRTFLERKQSVREGCGHSLGRFVTDIQTAMLSRQGTQKAAEKFLGKVGRELTTPEQKMLEIRAAPEAQGLGVVGSTILDHAAKKQQEQTLMMESRGTHSVGTARVGAGGAQAQGPVAAAKRRHRRELIERFRPGAEENQAALVQTRLQRDPLRGEGQGFGGVLPPESRHSSALKYSIKNAPKHVRQTAAAALSSPPSAPRRTPHPQQELVTVVTGPVDYTALLEQQKEHAQQLESANAEYTNLIDAYDRIQNGIQRKFSALIKSKDPITGARSLLPQIPSPPSATMQPM